MRKMMLVAALLSVSACNRDGGGNNAAASINVVTKAPSAPSDAAASASNVSAPVANASAAASLPPDFPGTDLVSRGAECIVYLGLSGQANARPGGYDRPIMQQAADQWRASMRIDGRMTEAEIQQLVGSSVNPLLPTSAALRDAASVWCVQNAPEPDPER